ncbi:hypothetical protein H2248_012279 [Termitomyces sp. 'cryptogamus']|nr:hypothetical protein H2248_012279 [Termitomyces sp. 'cryptogamus']
MPSPPPLGSPLHWTPAKSPMPLTPPIVALQPLPMPLMALYALPALEAATVALWWSPWQCPYLYMPSPIPSEPHPVFSKACPSPPPPYELPAYVWPTTFPTPPPAQLSLGATPRQLLPLPWNSSLRPYPSDPPPTAWQPTHSPTPALSQCKRHANSE